MKKYLVIMQDDVLDLYNLEHRKEYTDYEKANNMFNILVGSVNDKIASVKYCDVQLIESNKYGFKIIKRAMFTFN